ncbi:DUF885 family protein [Sphingomonas flavalba]|uniref:DUF885 family protein n=1 Tax=Sphingomonas flavalba TaxID=2559804 RepID=UPI0019D19387|nr:DUF885 family protein [Sphingomonas flavalba]
MARRDGARRGWLARATLVAGMMMAGLIATPALAASTGYDALAKLFDEWRTFERPAMADGVADYGTAAMARKAAGLAAFQEKLAAIPTAGWTEAELVDHRLVAAEMNGLDFDLRVLRPWARDPAFYVSVWPERSDVPSREGPVSFPEIELYAYKFPLAKTDQAVLTRRFAAIPGFLAQARANLKDSTARDLWVYGTQSLRNQAEALARLEAGTLTVTTLEGAWNANLNGASPALSTAVAKARAATEDFVRWLEAEAPGKTGPSGVGKENYAWYLNNVHLVPYSWDDEVALLRRELERAHATLKLEEHNNRALPPLLPADDKASLDRLAAERLDRFVAFLVDDGIIPDKPYLKESLVPQTVRFVPPGERQFFAHVTHREPMLLYAHDYHWIDLARMRDEPHASPIRRRALLSNIWDSRAEGFATGFEELVMHAGLYDDNPRARELVWIMLANRAARGLASLYVQANLWTLEQAGLFQAEWTPRGWAGARDSLTTFEQLLYLRQPGYGTSYVSGKLLFDRLMTRFAHAQDKAGKPFELRELMRQFNDAGMIPTTAIEQELAPPGTPTLGE